MQGKRKGESKSNDGESFVEFPENQYICFMDQFNWNMDNDNVEMEASQKGDIIIAPMTRPEYVPLMEKASGIITDEGGITCHAAIISRELNIPCIIGTQVATEILKDGDIVEINANEGIVRKID